MSKRPAEKESIEAKTSFKRRESLNHDNSRIDHEIDMDGTIEDATAGLLSLTNSSQSVTMSAVAAIPEEDNVENDGCTTASEASSAFDSLGQRVWLRAPSNTRNSRIGDSFQAELPVLSSAAHLAKPQSNSCT